MAAFVLIHSPFVGPFTWQPVACVLADRGQIAIAPSLANGEPRAPYWPFYANRIGAALWAVPKEEPLVVVAHSAAGVVVPAARAAMLDRAVSSYIFVDATLPRAGSSLINLIPPGVGITREQLRASAANGMLPPWGTGWPSEVWRQLIPDTELRERFVTEIQRAPLALYDESVPVVAEWPDAPCSYLRFSGLYADSQEQARRLGWLTREVRGGHLHMLAAPDEVATVLMELASSVAGHNRGSGV
jgi:hypothetical protein